jgi:hypothetical protein
MTHRSPGRDRVAGMSESFDSPLDDRPVAPDEGLVALVVVLVNSSLSKSSSTPTTKSVSVDKTTTIVQRTRTASTDPTITSPAQTTTVTTANTLTTDDED